MSQAKANSQNIYDIVTVMDVRIRNLEPGPGKFQKRILILASKEKRESKLISYERAFKMLENDMYISGIGQAVLELLSFKVGSGNHQRGISLLQKFSDIFGNMRLVLLKMTSHLTSRNFQILNIEILCKLCKISFCNLKK